VFHQLVYQRFTRNHDSIATPVGDQVEFALDKVSDGTMTDPSGALMNDRRERAREAPQPGGGEGRGDAVESHDVGTLFANLPGYGRPGKRRQWEAPIGKGDEGQCRIVCVRRPRHARVIEIATSESSGIAEGDESNTQECHSLSPSRRSASARI
jgi:hypothetical protein